MSLPGGTGCSMWSRSWDLRQTDGAQESLDGRRWSLVEVRVAGYQGIGESAPLAVRIDPTPGVTVIHGPNGSGKSSLADAVETALRGRPAPGLTGRGGQEPLWDRVHLARDAARATIDLELASADERLKIRCVLGQDGAVEQWSARQTSGGSSSEIDLTRTTWRDAVHEHRPVFGYAAVERRVQRAGDLQEFLEGLLAFGGCFDALKEAVEARSQEAKEAHRQWHRHRIEGQQAVARVDAEYPATTSPRWTRCRGSSRPTTRINGSRTRTSILSGTRAVPAGGDRRGAAR